jgi:hypothetical protein
MNTRKWLIVSSIVTLVMLVLAVGLTQAQAPGPEGAIGTQAETGIMDAVYGHIPVQGKLTDENGNPLPVADYDITFRLYDNYVGGTLLCSNTRSVGVVGGLFSTYINSCGSALNGRMVWLSIEVNDDGEMTPRQAINPVPYAFSLRPGAVISDTTSNPVLNINNYGSGEGLEAYSVSGKGVAGYSGSSSGVYGFSSSSAGVYGESMNNKGVYGVSTDQAGVRGYSDNGCGVEGSGNVGAAICAVGNGRIQSTANSYLWISGSSLQKASSDDQTRFEYDLYGGYKVYGGSDWGTPKTVLFPITIPGQLYGQNVKVTGLDLYYTISADLTGISISSMRRQNGVGAGDLILRDETDLTCTPGSQCSHHWSLTTNNVLSDQQGIVYVGFQLNFASDSAYVHMGGIRLTLEHD